MTRERDGGLGISELADLLHTSKSALRFYEKEGLVVPERASSSGYRRYSFQSLIELSDVMLFRRLDVPVKDIRRLLDSPVNQTDFKLDEAEASLLDHLRSITNSLEQIAARKRRIRQYQIARASGDLMVERPPIETLFRFDLNEREAMGAYLSNPESVRYAAFFPSAYESRQYVDCAITAPEQLRLEIVWNRPDDAGRWLECLMRTAYSLTGSNDLADHVARIEQQGLRAGQVIAEYLTFDWDEPCHERVDYYRVWIEILDA